MNVPVNIARPNWQCPHCLTAYREDLVAATACADAGPAPDTPQGVPVLILSGQAGGSRDPAPAFGATEVGRVKPVTVNGRRQHHRTVVVAGQQLDPTRLAGAGAGRDGLLVVTDTRRGETPASLSTENLSSFGALSRVFLGKNSWGEYRDTGVPVWVEAASGYRRSEQGWWRAPDEQERAALNVITGGLLDRIVELDSDKLTAAIRFTYGPSRPHRHQQQQPADLADASAGLMVAAAHGAPNHIWALRWLAAHLPQIISWQARTLQAWAAGQDARLPVANPLRVADTLPKNPGKRRLAAMEPFGETYTTVRAAIAGLLTISAPVNPVPDVADVESSVRTIHEGN